MTAKTTAAKTAQPPGLGGLCASWDDRCAHLLGLLKALADARNTESVDYASAFLAAVGPVEGKHQTARSLTSGVRLAAEYAAAEVAAYQVRIQAWLAEEGRPDA